MRRWRGRAAALPITAKKPGTATLAAVKEQHSERQKTLILARRARIARARHVSTLSTLLPAPATLTRVVTTAKSTRTADNMHVNKAHAALLIASAGALTGGTQKKPFPKLRPLKSALAAKPDLFGINEEDALLNSKREGQTSFRGAFEKAALLQADVFGAFRRRARLPSSNPLSATSRSSRVVSRRFQGRS